MNTGSAALQTGARVVTADGKQLGKVKDIREDQFKIDARFAPDYWLRVDTIEEIEADVVQLGIDKTDLGAAKVPDLKNIDDSNLPSNQTGL